MLVDIGAGHVNGHFDCGWLAGSVTGFCLPVAGRENMGYTSNYKLYKDTVGCKNTKMR